MTQDETENLWPKYTPDFLENTHNYTSVKLLNKTQSLGVDSWYYIYFSNGGVLESSNICVRKILENFTEILWCLSTL